MTDLMQSVCEQVAFLWAGTNNYTPNQFEECLEEIRKQIEETARVWHEEEED